MLSFGEDYSNLIRVDESAVVEVYVGGPIDFAQVAGRPEDQWFERKSVRVKPDMLARAFVGLANAEGGTVVIGVTDGQLEDVRQYARQVNALRQVPLSHCAPPPRVHFSEVEVAGGGGVHVLLARVEPGETLFETTAGGCYLRVGNSTIKLTSAQREELAYDRGASQYEARPMAGAIIEDLDSGLLDSLRTAIGATGDTKRTLAARSLLTMRAEVTIAAYLLLGEAPQEQLPHAHVRVVRHLDVAPGYGRMQSVVEGGDRRLEGPIPEVLEAASKVIDEWVPRRRALQANGKFGPTPIVPRDVWQEGLVNAVVHRSYSMAGDHIRVDIFPDRIEIESPGRFPGIVDVEEPLEITRYARNPRIARVCNDWGYTQEKGEGIKRMFEEMRHAGLTDPVYRQTAGSVRLTLRGVRRLSTEVSAALPTGAAEALDALRRAGSPMGTGEIQAEIGLGRPATLKALKALRDLGEIAWLGKSSKDPRAVWSLV